MAYVEATRGAPESIEGQRIELMEYRNLNILRINAYDHFGGADRTAFNLHRACRSRGSTLPYFVGRKSGEDAEIIEVPNEAHRSTWTKACLKTRNLSDRVGLSLLARGLESLTEPKRRLEALLGIQSFEFPGTWHLLDQLPHPPDLVHCHNLHGRYFDLRYLSELSQRVPVVITLHDPWLITGGCISPIDCDRWRSGCGACPNLDAVTKSRRDATASNWRRKAAIFARSRFYVASASQWMIDLVAPSILSSAVMESRVIPNGVDLDTFSPSGRESSRNRLGLPEDAPVLLFAASHAVSNRFKDYETIERAVERVAVRSGGKQVFLLVLGDDGDDRTLGGATIRFIPFEESSERLADYYRAADVYVHAAKAELFGNVIVEAMACGTPVVATAVGGIPEIIEHGETGFLTPPGDSKVMADAIHDVLANDVLRTSMSQRAVETVRQKYDLKQTTSRYLDWYQEIVAAK